MNDKIEVVKLQEAINTIEYKVDVLTTKIDKLEYKFDSIIEKQQCLETKVVRINTTLAGVTKFIWLIGGTVLGMVIKLLI